MAFISCSQKYLLVHLLVRAQRCICMCLYIRASLIFTSIYKTLPNTEDRLRSVWIDLGLTSSNQTIDFQSDPYVPRPLMYSHWTS